MARKMKDSGIEWIGEIPEGWEVHRMKSCISQRDGGAWGDEATGETGDCICLRIADFDYEHFRFTDSNNLTVRHYASPIIKKLLLQKNDILIEKSGGGEKTPVGRTVLFDKEYPALFANFMDRLRCSDFILPQYLQYVFVIFYKNRYTQNYIKQTTGIQNLDLSSMLADEFVPVPNLNEQKLIVCYLESKCSKIDNLLSKTRSSIEEYKKLKQAVITQSVTKGVRGEREMKDSGIDYIGQIPAKWVLGKLRNVGDTQNGISKSSEFFGKGFPFVSYSDVYKNYSLPFAVSGLVESTPEEQERYSVKEGDIFFTRTSETIEEVGFSCVCEKDIPNATFAGFLIRVRPFSDKLHTPYAKYYFRSTHLRFYLVKEMNLVTRASLGQSLLKSMPVLLPPLEEQKEIADYLDAKCAEIDKLIAKKEQLVKELESYKKSLIYEIVTGKREV